MTVRTVGLGMRAGEQWLFEGLDLDAGAGECLVLAGQNGSGKSTVLHLLYGLRAPSAGTVEVAGTGFLTLAVVRRPRAALWPEAAAVLVLAAAAVLVRPGPVVLLVLAAVLVVGGFVLFRPGPPPVARATRLVLVDGWRDRVLRVVGVQFLDLALLLPAARPVRPRPVTTGLRLAWLGVLGRGRHVPTAVLLGLTSAAAHRMLPALPDIVVALVITAAIAVALVR